MPFSAIEALQAFGAGRQMAMQDREYRRVEGARSNVQRLASVGDYAGAQREAATAGQFDWASSLGQLDEHQQERALGEAQAGGEAARAIRQLPPEQRATAFQQFAPLLRSRGFSDEELAAHSADLSDGALDNLIGQADTVARILTAGWARSGGQPTNIQREVEYYRSIGRPDLAEQRLTNHAEGGPVLFDINGDGAPDLVPRSYFNRGGGASQPAQQHGGGDLEAQAQAAIAAGADPAAVRVRLNQLRQGGPQASAPAGGFP